MKKLSVSGVLLLSSVLSFLMIPSDAKINVVRTDKGKTKAVSSKFKKAHAQKNRGNYILSLREHRELLQIAVAKKTAFEIALNESLKQQFNTITSVLLNPKIAYDIRVKYTLELAANCRRHPKLRSECNETIALIQNQLPQTAHGKTLLNYFNIYYPAHLRIETSPDPSTISFASTALFNDFKKLRILEHFESAPTNNNNFAAQPSNNPNNTVVLNKTNTTHFFLFVLGFSVILTALLYISMQLRKTLKRLNPQRAIVIDDDPLSLFYLKKILHELGVEAETFEHASDAQIAMKNRFYNYIFLDYSMPDISGSELLEKIDNDLDSGINNNSKIIFYTGTPKSVSKNNTVLKRLHVNGVLSKNTPNRHFMDHVRIAIAS